MKRLFILLLLVAIGFGIWYVSNKENVIPIDIADKGTNSLGKPDPLSGTYSFESGDGNYNLTFKNGKATRTVKEGSIVSTFDTEITEYKAYGDLNADKADDVAMVIGETSGLSAVPIYVAAYVSGPIRFKGTNAIYIGDRVQPEYIDIKNAIITVTYLDRGPDEPQAADPTIRTTKQFIFQGGLLIEK